MQNKEIGPQPGLVVTIDGPAGAGKSTVARMLADRLGFDFLDTGAMYRCVTLAVLRAGISLSDAVAVAELAEALEIEFNGSTVHLNGEDVSLEIRSPKVASSIGTVADNVAVRKLLSRLQRKWAEGRCVVTEGRDQGTEVFYDSPCKFFLMAGNLERAQRRMAELAARGMQVSFETVLAQQDRRDHEDRSRVVGRLRKADDAIEICTDARSLEQVVDDLQTRIAERLKTLPGRQNARGSRPTGEPSSQELSDESAS